MARNRVRMNGTCRTGKQRYRDRIAAQLALLGIDNINPRRRERRAYRCHICRGWHLTSQNKKSSTKGAA